MMMRWWWDDDDDLEGGDLNDGDFENDRGCDVDPTCSAKLALNAHQVDYWDGGNFDKSDYHDENILKIVAVVMIQLFGKIDWVSPKKYHFGISQKQIHRFSLGHWS